MFVKHVVKLILFSYSIVVLFVFWCVFFNKVFEKFQE